jgi:Flp pilus assembly protein TadB
LIITLLILTGAYDGIKYNYFGGFEEDRRREAEIFERIRIQEIKRKEAEAKYEEEMRPHRERFNKELLKVAAYLSKEK